MFRKKSIVWCLLLSFLLCPAFSAHAEDTAASGIAVSTPDELRAIQNDPYGDYELTADINMDGEEWTPFGFYGTLNGNGYAVYNLSVTETGAETETTVDGNYKTYETHFAGLFSELVDASVYDLQLLNANIRIETGDNCLIGLLAGYESGSTVSGCTLQGTAELHSGNYMAGVGGITGYALGTYDQMTVDAVLICVDESVGIKCEQFTGGAVATGYFKICNSTVHVEGYTSCFGYVHDGGFCGMHMEPEQSYLHYNLVCENLDVSGFIKFFECNSDRRAYCSYFCGENLNWTMTPSNVTQDFQRLETFDYSQTLYPHSDCDGTEFTEELYRPDCDDWGWYTYTCSKCGYQYRDHFIAPGHVAGESYVAVEATTETSGLRYTDCIYCGEHLSIDTIAPHTAGDWQTVIEPTFDSTGTEQRLCTDCGEVMEEREIPCLIQSQSLTLNKTALTLHTRKSYQLSAAILPEDTSDRTLIWSSGDETVVTVDENGIITPHAEGTCVVYCRASDGGAEQSCSIKVHYNLWQRFLDLFA